MIIKRCQLRYPHSNGECHRDHKQNRQLKLNGVLKPNAAGFHVDRLCLTSPLPLYLVISYHRGAPDYNISQFRSSPKKHKCSLGHLCFYIAVRKICYVSSMNDTRATIHPAELLILLQMNTTHSGLAFTLCHHQCQINETIRESPFIVVPRQNFDHITANHQR